MFSGIEGRLGWCFIRFSYFGLDAVKAAAAKEGDAGVP
jgi:hypothetical protein